MSSKAGESSRSMEENTFDPDLLSPIQDDAINSADISDVESFTRTVPDLEDDEELDMPSSAASRTDAPVGGTETPPLLSIEAVDDDESTVRSPGGAIQDADLSVNV
jgi:hypothetical protein